MLYPNKDISIRGYEVSDVPLLKKLYTDPEYAIYFRDMPHLKVDNDFVNLPTLMNCTMLVIEKDKKAIGFFCLYNLRPLARAISFGVILDKEYQKQGITKKVGEIIIPYVFDRLGLNKFDCSIIEFDERLISILKLWKFEVEGRIREEAFLDGKFYDCFIMSLTKKDYEEKIKCLYQ
jgi:RimJ/RimL family protein N-acetyltransferase